MNHVRKVKPIDDLVHCNMNDHLSAHLFVIFLVFSLSSWFLRVDGLKIIANSKIYDTFVMFGSAPCRQWQYRTNAQIGMQTITAPNLSICLSMRTTSITMIEIDDSPKCLHIYTIVRPLMCGAPFLQYICRYSHNSHKKRDVCDCTVYEFCFGIAVFAYVLAQCGDRFLHDFISNINSMCRNVDAMWDIVWVGIFYMRSYANTRLLALDITKWIVCLLHVHVRFRKIL